MFRSLRARLWLSYAALIGIALAVVGVVLLLFLLRDPVLYRKVFLRLATAQAILVTQPASQAQISQVSRSFNVRVLVFDRAGRLVQDSAANQPALLLPANLARATGSERDLSGRIWFYSVAQLSDGGRLIVAAPRPRVVPALAVLTDELVAPFIEGGVIALLLSLVLALLIARWIGGPLERMIASARTFPPEKAPSVPESGPHEVRELSRAFNTMLARVNASRTAQRDFVANVSHELKTPLTSIQGFAQALMDGTAEQPEARRQAAEVIYNEAGRMHRMALGLLELARLDSGTAEFQRAPVDLLALLRSVCDRFQPMAQAAGVTLQVELPESLPVLQGDGDRLAQVFGNLVDNAFKFTPPGGSVTIRAIEKGGEVQVAVNDTGKGISPAALPHIFDRFYRADSARSGGSGQGAGLGLAIAQEIITAHGGRITVRSAEGRGTGFVVHLPITKPY